MSGNLIWIDLETTGLLPYKDRILEIGGAITNRDLQILEEFQTAIAYPMLPEMDSYVRDMHIRNGLLGELGEYGTTLSYAEKMVLDVLRASCGLGEKLTLCGSSIHFDRSFIQRWMPDLDSVFSHRMLDVSTLKILWDLWHPDRPRAKGKGAHRAIDDIRESIEALRFYRAEFLR